MIKSQLLRKHLISSTACLGLIMGLMPSPLSLLWGQSKFPPLTRVITYESLKKGAVMREFEWTNPNGEAEKIRVLEMAIPIDDKMKNLTREFLRTNYGIDSIWLHPQVIVFHAMGDGDLKTSLEISSFLNDEIPSDWGNLHKAGNLPNGAHFIIDRDGTIICLTPPVSEDGSGISYEQRHRWMVKRHQDANPVAIGIENVTPPGNWVDLTHQQMESNARLARWLIGLESNRIKYLMSHHQFNDDKSYDLFLQAFNLKYLRKAFRTRGRKDIGDANLNRIVDSVTHYGYQVRTFPELH